MNYRTILFQPEVRTLCDTPFASDNLNSHVEENLESREDQQLDENDNLQHYSFPTEGKGNGNEAIPNETEKHLQDEHNANIEQEELERFEQDETCVDENTGQTGSPNHKELAIDENTQTKRKPLTLEEMIQDMLPGNESKEESDTGDHVRSFEPRFESLI
jgi:hypothetical protein